MTRYRLPDPKCKHVRRGLVSAGDPNGAYASTQVCDRRECIEDAMEWAIAQTHLPAVHRPDRRPAPTREPEPSLLDFTGTIEVRL